MAQEQCQRKATVIIYAMQSMVVFCGEPILWCVLSTHVLFLSLAMQTGGGQTTLLM